MKVIRNLTIALAVIASGVMFTTSLGEPKAPKLISGPPCDPPPFCPPICSPSLHK